MLSLVPLFVSNAWGYLTSEGIIEGLVERYLGGIATLQSLHVQDQVQRLQSSLMSMAGQAEVARSLREPGSPMSVNAFLAQELLAFPEFEALYIFDARGEILASAPLPPGELAIWLGPALRPPARPIEVEREPRPPYFPRVRLSVSLEEGTAPSRFLGGSIDVSTAGSLLQLPEHTAGTVETFVLDETGRPLFVSHPHLQMDYSRPLETPLIGAAAGTHAVYRDRLGIEVLGSTTDVRGLPWQLVVEVPLAESLAQLRELRQASLWLGTVLALLVIVTAGATSRRIVAPIRRLVSAAKRVGAGDLTARVDVGTRDEVGELGEAFNEMTARLAASVARIEDLHAQELERASQLATVGELAAGVAHEIKNPVVGIASGMDLVKRRLPEDRELSKIVEEMSRQTSRIREAVRDLLAFGRPAEPRFGRESINALVRRALTLVKPEAERNRVEVSLNLAQDLPHALMDAELIRQALVNLIVNAIQATPKGGAVVISTSGSDGGLEITVEDSGEGLTTESLEQIFKPFYTTKHRGTGLGLPITRGIVERHGGRLSVVSEPGEGSRFTVWLPLMPSATETKGEKAGP